ncbi:MAG: hypothetical protein QNI84_08955 [Henriciella sp.]|nr:hypothetical protein [Henriciella sp.]
MYKTVAVSMILAVTMGSVHADEQRCGTVPEGHIGEIPEWPNTPVNFACERGISELTLCILNRQGIEWLPNAGADFVAIDDGDSIYALTRDTHPAHPMIVRRKVIEEDGQVSIRSTGCGYGDKAASDELMAQYKELDASIIDTASQDQSD